MPDLPQPLVLRDWKKVACDFDRFVFDANKTGKHLPLYWKESSREANDVDGFGLPAYVGHKSQGPETNSHEAITTMSAVLGGTLVGIDKRGYAAAIRSKFHAKDGIGLYLNRFNTTGDSFWYDTFPSLLFLHLNSRYPEIADYREQLVSTAEVWRNVLIDLGASDESLPELEHTGYDFSKKQPVDRGWKEPDVAAGIACIEYLSFLVTGNKKYQQAAGWALDWMAQRDENPFYENLAPYGAYAAARSNAEQGTDYPVGKLIEWTLDGTNPRKWGAVLERWHGTETYGLIGSVYPNYEYAFAMNSFHAAGIMAPIARYDERYARDLAKWILNVAVNCRYFYPNAWPSGSQSSWEWAKSYDPDFCIPYEGLRKQGTTRDYPERDRVAHGVMEGDNPESPEKEFVLVADEAGKVDYRGKVSVPPGESRKLIALISHRKRWNGQSVDISISKEEGGSGAVLLSYREEAGSNLQSTEIDIEGELWIRIAAEGLQPGAKIVVDDLLVETRFKNPPHVGGDPTVHGWGATDLCVYAGSGAAYLGAMIERSNVDGIILIDPVATDMMPPKTFPTRLVFNPYKKDREIEIDVGAEKVFLYDSLTDRMLTGKVSGEIKVAIPAKQAVMLVYLPTDQLESRGGKLFCNGVIVDYQYQPQYNR